MLAVKVGKTSKNAENSNKGRTACLFLCGQKTLLEHSIFSWGSKPPGAGSDINGVLGFFPSASISSFLTCLGLKMNFSSYLGATASLIQLDLCVWDINGAIKTNLSISIPIDQKLK